MKKIIIVESPSKSKTIEGYMGKDYKVLSSKGHVLDLATSGPGGLGIDVENNFTPTYKKIKGKSDLIKSLIKECKGNQVYLATDPDREGEAISWHLSKILELNLDDTNRIEFNEITKPAILEAFNNPRKINLELVQSQETRRMLDRIIGFKLSKLLQSKIKSKSAGRVQSVALKLIVDLEKIINAFVPEEYYEITAIFDGFKAALTKYKDKVLKIKSKEEADKILSELTKDFIVDNIEIKDIFRDPKHAFTTSTLQQEASSKLNYDSKRTMRIAQSLYEGKAIGSETVGLITYMRTDSTRLSTLFTDEAKKYITDNFGQEYLGKGLPHKKLVNAQEAHEAIRPTSILRTPEMVSRYLSAEENKVYKLIYNKALASLMAPAKVETMNVKILNNGYEFRAKGSRILFDGYLKVIQNDSKDTMLPELKKDQILNAIDIESKQNFTTPPSRYTEAQLIKDMEELGIGRPSTYAQTIETLKYRGYVVVKEKKFVPTEQGILTVDKLHEFFNEIINVSYTANMEELLDEIANGTKQGKDILKDFYDRFIPMLDKANELMEKIPDKETGEICPECGKNLVYKHGRFGDFIACSGFPSCRYIKKKEKEPVVDTEVICPKCNEGHIILRKANRGRSKGKDFYACNNFPKCKNTFTIKPINETCPICNSLMGIDSNNLRRCTNEKCYKENSAEKK